MRRLAAQTAVILDAGCLALCRPSSSTFRNLAHFGSWVALEPDAACAELARTALWLLALWMAVGLLVTAGSSCAGAMGACARALQRAVLPPVARRLLAGALGAGIVVGPGVASAAVPTTASTPVASAAAWTPAPGPSWPVDAPSTSGSAPTWPTTPPSATHSETPPARTPGVPVPRPGSAAPRSPAPSHQPGRPPAPTQHPAPVPAPTPRGTPPRSTPVVVRPGDSLWLIAQRRLAPDASDVQVAAEWPRWYAANRAAVGADPDLILPGEVLQAPPAAAFDHQPRGIR